MPPPTGTIINNQSLPQREDVINATIVVEPITPDDNSAVYTANGQIFTDYIIMNKYENDQHTYMAGVTSPGGFNGNSVAFFQLSNSTMLWICDWTACKWNEQPEIPDPFSVADNWELLDAHLEPSMLTVAPDGVTPLYRISGTYYYGNTNPSASIFPDIDFPRPPWLGDVFDRTMPDSQLEENLMDRGSSSSSVGGGQTLTGTAF